MIIGQKMLPLECTQGFSKFWPSFWPDMTYFRTGLRFIKTNILKMFHDNRTENVAYGAYTRFF